MAEVPERTTVPERRLRSEWSLLERLTMQNPHRLGELRAIDHTFFVKLRGTPGVLVPGTPREVAQLRTRAVTEHCIRITFPEYFPAAPMEVYLERPAVHPNIHPETGFVCVWDRHRVSNTIEHAIHKTVAILGWKLRNLEPVHVMQVDTLAEDATAWMEALAAPSLDGVLQPEKDLLLPSEAQRKRLYDR